MRLAQARREKAVLERRDITSAQVAKACRVTPSSYSRYENDLSKPDDEDLARIAEYFGVTRAWLRFGEGQKYPDAPIEGVRVAGPAPKPKRLADPSRRAAGGE